MRTTRLIVALLLAAFLINPAWAASADDTSEPADATPTVEPVPTPGPTPEGAPDSAAQDPEPVHAEDPPPVASVPTKAARELSSVAANETPVVASDDDYTVVDGHTLAVDSPGFLANDTIDDNPFGIDVGSGGGFSHGTATWGDDGVGSFTYLPDAGFSGDDTAEYVLRRHDGSPYDSAIITVHVQPRIDPRDDEYTVVAGHTLTIDAPGFLANDVVRDDTPFGIDVGSGGGFSHGTTTWGEGGAFTYTPDKGFGGDDVAVYVLRVPGIPTPYSAKITVHVLPLLDPQDDEYTVVEGHTLTIDAPGFLANDTIRDDTPFGIDAADTFHHGTTTWGAGGALTYTPDEGFGGDDVAVYVLRSPGILTPYSAKITIHVVPNHGPDAVDDEYTVVAGHTLHVDPPGILANDVDEDGDTLEVTSFAVAQHAKSISHTDDGGLTYTPEDGFVGDEKLGYRVSDGTIGSTIADLTIHVVPNHVPVAVDDQYTVVAGQHLHVDAPGYQANDTDADGDAVHLHDYTPPTHAEGFQLGYEGPFDYIPEPGFVGDDTVTYRVDDGFGGVSGLATVTIHVVEPPPDVVLGDDVYTVEAGQSFVVDDPGVLANDIFRDGSDWMVSGCDASPHAEIVCAPGGGFRLEPDHGFVGDITFTYGVQRRPLFAAAEVLSPMAVVDPRASVTVHVKAADVGAGDSGPQPSARAGALLPDTGTELPWWLVVLGGTLTAGGFLVLRRARLDG